MFSFFLREGADANKMAATGMTPMHLAMLIGNVDMILTMLGAHNVNVAAKTKQEIKQVII